MSKKTLVMEAIKSKLVELKIVDEDDLHAKLIESVLSKPNELAEALEEFSDDIPVGKFRKLTEVLQQLDLNTSEEEAAISGLDEQQLGEQIRAKLAELRIDDEDNLYARLIDSVRRKGVSAGLDDYTEEIAGKKLKRLLEMLTPMQNQLKANAILAILVRLKIENEDDTLHSDVVKAVLAGGPDALAQFNETIAPKKFNQLVKELNEKFPQSGGGGCSDRSPTQKDQGGATTKPTTSTTAYAFTLAAKIDFNSFNALDSSATTLIDFHEAVQRSFGEPNFAEIIATHLIYLIKRQQDLKGFIDDLHKSVPASEKMSLRELLCAFLFNCSEDVRAKCYQLLSTNNPVPLIVDQGGECFAIESHWIAMADESNHSDLSTMTRVLSCGLEATCKGKSKLLNTLFTTSFEENEYAGNRFFNGTLDMQLVRNFGAPGNHLCIADAHGVIGGALLEKMASSFDAIVVQLNESSCQNAKHIELIGRLASRVQQRLFVIVRDSASDDRSNCCNQQAIGRALSKLGGLVGSVNGPRIRLCRVPKLVKENQCNFYGNDLRVFVFDELRATGVCFPFKIKQSYKCQLSQ